MAITTTEKEIEATGKPPYSAICALGLVWPNGATELGTGYIFGERTIFTVAHNLYDIEKGGYASKISITPGATGLKQPFGQIDVGPDRLRVYPGWKEGDSQADFGAILLPGPLGKKTGWSDFAPLPDLKAGEVVILTGYPSALVNNESGAHLMQSRGKLGRRDGNLVHHLAKGTLGQSGAPIWRERDTFPFVVVCGFHKGNHKVEPVNVALMIAGPHHAWMLERMKEAEAPAKAMRTLSTAAESDPGEPIAKARPPARPPELSLQEEIKFTVRPKGSEGLDLDLTIGQIVRGSIKVALAAGTFTDCDLVLEDEDGKAADHLPMFVSSSGSDDFHSERFKLTAQADGPHRLVLKELNGVSAAIVRIKIKPE